MGKSQFKLSPETENSHWLKGNKSVISLTMANRDSIQAQFVACSSCHHVLTCATIHNVAVVSKIESYIPLRNGKRNANGGNAVVQVVSPPKSIMEEQIQEMEEDSLNFLPLFCQQACSC